MRERGKRWRERDEKKKQSEADKDRFIGVFYDLTLKVNEVFYITLDNPNVTLI